MQICILQLAQFYRIIFLFLFILHNFRSRAQERAPNGRKKRGALAWSAPRCGQVVQWGGKRSMRSFPTVRSRWVRYSTPSSVGMRPSSPRCPSREDAVHQR